MEKVIVASNNKGKIKEIKEIFKEYEILSLKDISLDIEVEEDQDTFALNAAKKAKEISDVLDGAICIADDSGLCIEALDGFPGVYTNRWMEGTDREKNLALISKMQGKTNRNIKHVCAIAVAKNGKVKVFESCLDGKLSNEIKGSNGFGFDEIFIIEDGRTLAELTQEEKNEISARKKALSKVNFNI